MVMQSILSPPPSSSAVVGAAANRCIKMCHDRFLTSRFFNVTATRSLLFPRRRRRLVSTTIFSTAATDITNNNAKTPPPPPTTAAAKVCTTTDFGYSWNDYNIPWQQRPLLRRSFSTSQQPVSSYRSTTLIQNNTTCSSFPAAPDPSSSRTHSTTTAAGTTTTTTITTSTGPVTERLFELIAGGTVQPDDVQLQDAQELDRLYHDLINKGAPPPLVSSSSQPPEQQQQQNQPQQSSSSFFGSWFGSSSSSSSSSSSASTSSSSTSTTANLERAGGFVKGVYSYGGVGCGKTFLMDLLYDAIGNEDEGIKSGWADDRQKVHYHKFMLDVHQFMHISRKEQQEKYGDNAPSKLNLIDPVVDHILQNGRLLCLDEFQVTDVADAMILKEIFTGLWQHGCVLVATSNRPPNDLYKDGLQRDRFVPFIKMLEERCEVVSLMKSTTDYRMVISALDTEANNEEAGEATETTKDSLTSSHTLTHPKTKQRPKQVYWFGKGQSKELRKVFNEMTKGRPTNPTSLETQGRKVKIPMACKTQNKMIAMFSFEDLCQKALGAADYLVIGQQFSTVFVYSIPQMDIPTINWLRRFITFVDTMYELKVTLILQTQAPSLQDIFILDDDKDSYTQDEVFAFDRTLSRLEEMKSTAYLSSKWLGVAQAGLPVSDDDDTFSAELAAAAAAPVKTSLILQPSLADSPTSFHEPISLSHWTGPLGK